jgi:hypothetical protein
MVSSNKTDRHDITEIFLKVALNTIKQSNTLTDNFQYNAKSVDTENIPR